MRDLRDAFRSIRSTPVVSIVAILSLALGIGANTAVFSIFDRLMLRSLPVHEPDRLFLVIDEERGTSSWTNPIWEQIRRRSELFEGATAWWSTRFNLSRGGQTQFVEGIWASGGFFEKLGVPAILGRTFNESDDARGGGPDGPVAVLSYRFWQGRYGGAADVVGQTLTMEGTAFTVIGVTAPSFFGPEVGETFDVAVPLGTEPLIRGRESRLDRRSTWWLRIMVRLKPDQTVETAAAALRGVQPQIREATLPDNWRPQDLESYLKAPLALRSAAAGTSWLRNRYRQPLTAVLVVVGLVLLIACANIANLQLARAASRRHEMSVRLALGASRLRLVRQLLTESLLLSGLGAGLGLFFAMWGSRLLVAQLSTERNPVFLDLSVDWRILAFTAAAAVGTALLFGTAPSLRAAQADPNEALKERGRGTATDRRASLRNSLVVVQVSLSLVLVIAAGLFVRTFSTLVNLDLGFDRDQVLVVQVNARSAAVEPSRRPALYQRLRQAAGAAPGVAHAASSLVTPVSGSTWNTLIELPDGPQLPEGDRIAYVNYLSPKWFTTLGIPLLAGRDFDERDRMGAPQTAIVNETFAKRFSQGQSPLGQVVYEAGMPEVERSPIEIVGLVRDAVYRSLREPVPPTMYLPMAQLKELPPRVNISVRTAGPPAALLTRGVAAALEEVDPHMALTFRALGDQVESSLTQERLVAMLSAFFGALALLLAGLGLYGVTSYAVHQRRFEIGVRMALGAAPAGVVRMVLSRVGLLVGCGLAAGGLAALWAAQFAESLLFGLAPRDPATFVSAAALLTAVGVLSGWMPARRAARIDPARVLRDE